MTDKQDAGAESLPPLPRPSVTYADHSYPAFSKKDMREYALAALRAQQPAPLQQPHVVKIHKFGKKGSQRHQYEMSDGSIQELGEMDALMSAARHANSLKAKDAEIADLRAELASRGAVQVRNTSDKLLTIIAYAYQIAGAHNAPKHILDVLANPEAATSEQVEAMLPYQPEQALDMGNRPASIDHDAFWALVVAYCKGVGNEGQALVDYINAWAARRAVPDAQPVEIAKPAQAEPERDPLYDKAVQVVRAHNRASLSLVQRTLHIGYNRTARLFEAMEAAGVVSALDEYGHRTMIAAAPVTGDAK